MNRSRRDWTSMFAGSLPMPVRLRRAAQPKPWPLLAGMALAIAGAAAVYLWPSTAEFPMDDAYIHLVYAENLAERGALVFNMPGESGVGTSSILWVLLIAAGHKVGLPAPWLMKGLGIGSLVVVAAGLYLLLAPIWRAAPAAATSVLVGLSGNMLWFALNGMETMLFLALGLAALLLYRRGRWPALGLALGLLTLTRPEGIALLPAILCVEMLRHRSSLHTALRGQPGRHALVAATGCLAVAGPWFAYLLARTGQWLPTSGTAKQFSSAIALGYVLETAGGAAVFARFLPLVYCVLWLAYFLMFVLGGASLPRPSVVLEVVNSGIPTTISLWSLVGWSATLALLAAACRRILRRGRWPAWLDSPVHQPLAALFLWALWHNVAYMVFLPTLGTASRYGALNHVLLWLLLVLGLRQLAGRPRLRQVLGGCLLVVAAANTIYWNAVYDANLEHMERVRIAAARYLRDSVPAGEVCAAFDVGALRYYGERPLVDLGGLTDPDATRWYAAGAVDGYLAARNVTYLALPGRAGRQEEGWLDLVDILGLDRSPLFRLEPVQAFEIDHDRWLLGYLPTTNYQASVVIYRMTSRGPETPLSRSPVTP